MPNIYIVLIVNKHFVRWEIFDSSSATIKNVFEILQTKYDICRCILEIGAMSFMNHRFCTNNLLSDILLREKIGTIYVTTKHKILVLNNET